MFALTACGIGSTLTHNRGLKGDTAVNGVLLFQPSKLPITDQGFSRFNRGSSPKLAARLGSGNRGLSVSTVKRTDATQPESSAFAGKVKSKG